MAIDLASACLLAQDITSVTVSPLESATQQAAFCTKNQFYPAQSYLQPQALRRIFASLPHGEILSLTDLFRVRYLFLFLGEIPVEIGPFCTELFSQQDCQILLQRTGIRDITAQDLQVLRGTYPVYAESDMIHLAHSLARSLGLAGTLASVHRVDLGDDRPEQPQDVISRRLYAEMISERYQIEAAFMEHIRQGNANAAIQSWRQLHQAVAYAKKLGSTMETARTAAAINRTTIRMAAAEAGLPALVNDMLSGESAAIIRNAKSIDTIDLEHERIIRAYCQAIRERRDHQYSNLVLSAIYEMEHHYTERITAPSLAEELEVSPAKLTFLFRKETGQTPLAYLTNVRMRQAARRLTESSTPVNSVAAEVGILDANYFIKLFKRAYGQTPLAYRRSHQL